ncbi:hypothetical protein ACIPYU_19655 [Paenarthrobacter nicotinovorans]|uniref:hypothetical protein n=1 Tax=Paenarthrobacter nicotinovorans TaxID=29320 RepID=UPI003805B825
MTVAVLLGVTACAAQTPSVPSPGQGGSVAGDQQETGSATIASGTLTELQMVPYTEDQITQVLRPMQGDVGRVVPKALYKQKFEEDAAKLERFKVTPESCRPFLITPDSELGETIQEGMTAGALNFGTDVPGQSSMLAAIDPKGGHPKRFEALQAAALACSSVSFSYGGQESSGSVQRIEPLSTGNVLTVRSRWKTHNSKNTTPQEGIWMFAQSGSVMVSLGSVLTSTTMDDVPQSQVDDAANKMKSKLLQTFEGFSKLT